jgi:hypothetical protein
MCSRIQRKLRTLWKKLCYVFEPFVGLWRFGDFVKGGERIFKNEKRLFFSKPFHPTFNKLSFFPPLKAL